MSYLIKEILNNSRDVLRNTWGLLKRRWLLLLTLFALAFGITFALFPYDNGFYHRITDHRPENLVNISNMFRRWGDFRDVVTITLLVFLVGWIAKKRTWRTAAIGCFLAACMAGLLINGIRTSTGRPRPYTDMVDGFYGPTTQYKMMSFPSGNATTSSALATSLLIALPFAGIPALLSAVGVVCASVYSCTHHVSDVTAGMLTGIIIGLFVGLTTRRLMKVRLNQTLYE